MIGKEFKFIQSKITAKDSLFYLTKDFLNLVAVSFIFYTGFYLVIIAIPPFAESQGASITQIGWITAVFFLATMIGRPLAAYVIERTSPEISLLAGAVLTVFACAIIPFLITPAAIAFGRAINGLTVALFSTAFVFLAANHAPLERRGQALAIIGIPPNVAASFSPSLGLALVGAFGYSLTFLSASGFIAVCALLTVPLVKGTAKKTAAARDNHEADDISPSGIFSLRKSLTMPFLVIFSFALTYSIHLSFIIVMADDWDIPPQAASLYYAFYAAAIIIARIFSGRASDHYGRSWVIVPGNLLVGAALLILSQAHSISGLLITATLYGIGAGYVYPGVLAQMLELSPARRRGTATASFFIANESGMVIGGPLFGWLATLKGASFALVVLAFFPIAGALLHLFFSNKFKEVAAEA